MIHMLVDYCMCCMLPVEKCPMKPPPELTYEVLVPAFPEGDEDECADSSAIIMPEAKRLSGLSGSS